MKKEIKIRPSWYSDIRFVPRLVVSALLACGCTIPGTADESTSLLGTSWLAEDIEQRGVIDMLQSTLTFETDVRVIGMGGCNAFFGSAKLSGEYLELGPLGSTRMACAESIMDQEFRFLAALEAARQYRLDPETDLLYFTNENGDTILRFSRLTVTE